MEPGWPANLKGVPMKTIFALVVAAAATFGSVAAVQAQERLRDGAIGAVGGAIVGGPVGAVVGGVGGYMVGPEVSHGFRRATTPRHHRHRRHHVVHHRHK
jgi:hypothetical protein